MRRTKYLRIFEMVLLCALGLTLVLYPEKTWKTSLSILGTALLVGGVLAALYYFLVLRRRDAASRDNMLVGIAGCTAALVGLIMVLIPSLFTNAFGFVAGILVAFSGILNLVKAIDLRRADQHDEEPDVVKKRWLVLMALSLVTIALGVLIFIDPFKKQATLVILVGAVLIYNGVLGIVTAIQEE